MKRINTNCLIIGSGPAGYTASIYLGRALLYPIILTGPQIGGQLTTTTMVDNYPGFPNGIEGNLLMNNLKKQSDKFGAKCINNIAKNINLDTRPFTVELSNGNIISSTSIILAMGSSHKTLNIKSEEKYLGYGLSFCATCDGFFFKKKIVAIIGGGDKACEEAIYLSNICVLVYIIVRNYIMKASKINQEKVFLKKNIIIIYNNEIIDIIGNNNKINSILLYNNIDHVKKNIIINGLFVAIGYKPNTDLLHKYKKILLDDDGYIITLNKSSKTNIEGVFSCGDIQDKIYKQAITSAGSGCIAAIDAEQYINNLKYHEKKFK
ncbi:MAG: thioredoxin-disulfide reductase [Bacteroides sp.]|nr:MAG: thioredoxin-disulfide reductase [Bacteroides sp.]